MKVLRIKYPKKKQRCKKCNSRKVTRGYFNRGRNNLCEQATGDSGYYCERCGHIEFDKSEDEYIKVLPYWCSVNGRDGLLYSSEEIKNMINSVTRVEITE